MKIIIAIAMYFVFMGAATAGEIITPNGVAYTGIIEVNRDEDSGMMDLTTFFGNLRGASMVNLEGEVFFGGHVPVVSFIGRKSKLEYININAGFIYSPERKKSDFTTSIGFRLDNYIAKLDNYPNVRTAKMPAIEVGPFVSYNFRRVMFGVMAAIGFGGK